MSSFQGHFGGWGLAPFSRASGLAAPTGEDAGQTALCPDQALQQTADALAEQAQDQAVAALVEQYAPALYRVAFSVVRNNSEAEDAVQETFVRVLRNRHKLSGIRDARVWLVRITWNVVLDRKRRAKTRPETDDVADLARTLPCREAGGEAAAIASEGYLKLLRVIDTLPTKEREALLLSAVEELTTAEIASVLGTSESSIRSRLFRARQLMGRLLAGTPPAGRAAQ